ncbi:MAG: c-type cytochrome [Thermoflexales bacterium]
MPEIPMMRAQPRLSPGRRLAIPLAVILVLGAIGVAAIARGPGVVELHARVAEAGGFSPASIEVVAGQPMRLRLVSDDMTHGFAIGKMDQPNLAIVPGQPVETELRFDQPGRYVYYCTQFCGPGHWRMRGVIDVLPAKGAAVRGSEPPPAYVGLGLDIDAPHPAAALPSRKPSARRGAALAGSIPAGIAAQAGSGRKSPEDIWRALRDNAVFGGLSDDDVWDGVAWLWLSAGSQNGLPRAATLYASNCAACHGASGNGDGVMAAFLASGANLSADPGAPIMRGQTTVSPTRFTDPAVMLGASPALLEGKIIRGGMGTGMPYWGPIFSDADGRLLVNYLWRFQFNDQE